MMEQKITAIIDENGCLIEHIQFFATEDHVSLGECWKKYDKNSNLIYERYSTGVVKTYRYDDDGNVVDFYDLSKMGAINAIRLYTDYSEGYDVKAELAFAYGGSNTISWIRPAEREIYEPGINGYTLFFDEREKAPFAEQRKPFPESK